MAPIHDLMLLLELETQAAAVRGALDDAAHEEAMAYGTAALQGVREAAPEEVAEEPEETSEEQTSD